MSKRMRIESIITDPLQESKQDAVHYWINQGQWPTSSINLDHVKATRQPPLSSPESQRRHSWSTQLSYNRQQCQTQLEQHKSYLTPSLSRSTKTAKDLCQQLVQQPQDIYKHILFRDKTFEHLCNRIQHRNQAMILQHITSYIVPSAEQYMVESNAPQCLIEAWEEPWTNCKQLFNHPPRPNYAVGFQHSAFTADQHSRLKPLIGNVFANDQSFCLATHLMYFPFLTCQVHCSADCLDMADRENAYSMTVATRGVVEFFKSVNRQDEIDGQILGFSVSHNHRNVRIYGHYVEFDGDTPSYYRYPISILDFTEQDGRDRWTSFRIIRNIYDTWVPMHLKRLRSVIDKIPMDPDHHSFGSVRVLLSPHSVHSAHHIKQEEQTQKTVAKNVHLTPANSVQENSCLERPRGASMTRT